MWVRKCRYCGEACRRVEIQGTRRSNVMNHPEWGGSFAGPGYRDYWACDNSRCVVNQTRTKQVHGKAVVYTPHSNRLSTAETKE